jgi:hypothetical protein
MMPVGGFSQAHQAYTSADVTQHLIDRKHDDVLEDNLETIRNLIAETRQLIQKYEIDSIDGLSILEIQGSYELIAATIELIRDDGFKVDEYQLSKLEQDTGCLAEHPFTHTTSCDLPAPLSLLAEFYTQLRDLYLQELTDILGRPVLIPTAEPAPSVTAQKNGEVSESLHNSQGSEFRTKATYEQERINETQVLTKQRRYYMMPASGSNRAPQNETSSNYQSSGRRLLRSNRTPNTSFESSVDRSARSQIQAVSQRTNSGASSSEESQGLARSMATRLVRDGDAIGEHVKNVIHAIEEKWSRDSKKIEEAISRYEKVAIQADDKLCEVTFKKIDALISGKHVTQQDLDDVDAVDQYVGSLKKHFENTANNVTAFREMGQTMDLSVHQDTIMKHYDARIKALDMFSRCLEMMQKQETHEIEIQIKKIDQELKIQDQEVDRILKVQTHEIDQMLKIQAHENEKKQTKFDNSLRLNQELFQQESEKTKLQMKARQIQGKQENDKLKLKYEKKTEKRRIASQTAVESERTNAQAAVEFERMRTEADVERQRIRTQAAVDVVTSLPAAVPQSTSSCSIM